MKQLFLLCCQQFLQLEREDMKEKVIAMLAFSCTQPPAFLCPLLYQPGGVSARVVKARATNRG
jgi:hypothetical protein